MVFQSRIQWMLFAPIFLLLTGIGILCLYQGVWPVTVINALVMLLILHTMFTTNYTISGETLMIRSGMLYRTEIPIKSISKIKPTSNILSSPALSLKGRVELFYGKSATIIISPVEQHAFLNALLKINPEIAHSF